MLNQKFEGFLTESSTGEIPAQPWCDVAATPHDRRATRRPVAPAYEDACPSACELRRCEPAPPAVSLDAHFIGDLLNVFIQAFKEFRIVSS